MSFRPPLTTDWAWRACLSVITSALLLGACSPPDGPTQVVLPSTTIPKSGKVQSTQVLTALAPRLLVAGADGGLLAARAGKLHPEIPPHEYAMYWDYSAAGTLAFASSSWQRASSGNFSVTDFWVHDYLQGESQRWFASNVGRVLWSPYAQAGNQRAALVLFDPALGDFSLAIATGPGEARVLAEHASYAFSWDPDGSRLVFVRRASPAGLYMVSVEGGQARRLSDFAYQNGGWLFDKPLWISEHNVLIVAENDDYPLRAVPLDSSPEFVPVSANGGNIPGPRPDVMLWARDRRQLVVSGDSGFASETWVHTLSENLRTVEHSVWLADASLKGWWQPGESVLVLGPAGADVQSLPVP